MAPFRQAPAVFQPSPFANYQTLFEYFSMGSIVHNHKHVLVYAFPVAWGHNKPLCPFVVHMLDSDPEVVITYFTAGILYSKIVGEFKRLPAAKYDALQSRLHIIDIAGSEIDLTKPVESFAPAFESLYSSAPITCRSSGKTIGGLPSPSLAIIDPFTNYAYEAVWSISSRTVPILAWWTSNAGALIRVVGPAHLGGVAAPALESAEGRAAKKRELLAREPLKYHDRVGSTVHIAGLDPHYDYEWFPQKTKLIDAGALFETLGTIYTREADGIICVSGSSFEPEATAAVKQWFSSMNKSWYSIGPLSLDDLEGKSASTRGSEADAPVEEFLNRIENEFGPRSLIYISFGTYFWPEVDDRLWAVIDGLLEKRQPFLFAHPSPLQKFPDEIKKKISDSGIAMELVWSPQELILAHPVTGWFISHGGWNSTQESFKYYVPQIFWPFQADQPTNAFRLTTIKAGFELIEIRTGEDGTRIPYGYKELPEFTAASAKAEIGGLIEKLKGEEGAIVRANHRTLSDAMNKQWSSDGDSRQEFVSFMKKYV
ncbi:hypothetical protein D9757_010223 [Collybiopsis confluens]|uniref:UDP-Glycosyltransferase/glycogen phosphorylase n=1 Tax=Collybiopsis confluens TaxID=2823264 RepID=A0A8H5GPF5_9AGAR|nr:hypothetical protein D9757_010223 [Collybiopsis confluens]